MDSTGALELPDIPESLLVVGGGYIGLEMGTVYAELGTKVSVVELTDGLLPGADRDLVKPLHARLEKLFAAIHLKTKVVSLADKEDSIEVNFASGRRARRAHRTLRPRPGFRWPAAEQRRSGIGAYAGRTRPPRILPHRRSAAHGRPPYFRDRRRRRRTDVGPQGVASRQNGGRGAARRIGRFQPQAIPAVVFTDPEIAWAGLTEAASPPRGAAVEVARYPWAASGRAESLGRTEGLTKLLFDPETERMSGRRNRRRRRRRIDRRRSAGHRDGLHRPRRRRIDPSAPDAQRDAVVRRRGVSRNGHRDLSPSAARVVRLRQYCHAAS